MITLLLVIIYLSFISLGLPDSLLGSAWPAMRTDMALPVSFAGILSFIITGGTIISSLLSSKVIRRFGTGKVTAVSVGMTAFALMGFSMSPGFLWLCILAVPLGLGAGSVDAALNNFVALHYKASHMSWLHCFWGVGATAGPIIMSLFLSREAGWKIGYRTIGIIQVCLVIILFASLPLWRKVGGSTKTEELTGASPKFNDILRIHGAKPAFFTFFCYCALESSAGLWGSSYLVLIKGVSSGTAAKLVSLYYFGITLGRFISGFITMKLSNRSLIRIGEIVIIAGLVCLLLPTDIVLIQTVGFLIIGLGCAPVFPSLIHETPTRFGKDLSQAFIGIQMACAYIGSALMPPIFGFVAQRTSFALFPFFLLAALLLMTLANERINSSKTNLKL